MRIISSVFPRSRVLSKLCLLALFSFMTLAFLSCATTSPPLESHFTTGYESHLKGDFKKAISEYRLAINLDPKNVDASNNLGGIYLKQGHFHDALRVLKKGLSSRPNHLNSLKTLAITYTKMYGKGPEALKSWEKVLKYVEDQKEGQEIRELIEGLEEGINKTPELIVSFPKPGEPLSLNRLKIIGKVNSFVGIDRLEIWIDAKPRFEEKSVRGGHFEIDVEVPLLKEGKHTLLVTAYDKRGRKSEDIITFLWKPKDLYYTKKWGVVIGINEYNDPSWGRLEYAVNDARSVAKMLRENLGFDGVVEVLGQDATREGILTALGSGLRKRVGKNDLVFIYFAGHGNTQKLIEGKMGYIIPVEGKKAAPFATGISMKTFRDTRNLIGAKHIFYAVDACYSGFVGLRGGNEGGGEIDKVDRVKFPSTEIMTAGREGETAQEHDGHGVFTHYLLRGLKGEADRDSDNVVLTQELSGYVQRQVQRATGRRQHPQFITMDGAGSAVFPYRRN